MFYREVRYPDWGSNCRPALDISCECALTMLEDCCIIFVINFQLGRTDALINHPPKVEKHHQLDLPRHFLLPNCLMSSSPLFASTSHFHIWVCNCHGESTICRQWLSSRNTCNLDFEVSSGPYPTRGEIPFALVWANEEPTWNTHFILSSCVIIFGSLTFATCSRISSLF